jgi:hypothetical protein
LSHDYTQKRSIPKTRSGQTQDKSRNGEVFSAAGVVAHDSAGPKEDIVVPYEGAETGRRAVDAESYAKCMAEMLGDAKLREQLATK